MYRYNKGAMLEDVDEDECGGKRVKDFYRHELDAIFYFYYLYHLHCTIYC
jgi:hypothetical protein